jgi:hypothetical protein
MEFKRGLWGWWQWVSGNGKVVATGAWLWSAAPKGVETVRVKAVRGYEVATGVESWFFDSFWVIGVGVSRGSGLGVVLRIVD